MALTMATYIIGDVHGCYAELQQLLTLISFNPEQDRLGFTGDLVNRGPDSLAVLRFIKRLSHPMVVLGNHDLYLLVIGYGLIEYNGAHTLNPILRAPDRFELLDWLRQQPLALYDAKFNMLLVHAGAPPQWTLSALLDNARQVEAQLRSPDFLNNLRELEGDQPLVWRDQLIGADRMRYIMNALTRMRFCTREGTLDLKNKSSQSTDPNRFRPWFEWYTEQPRVFFGHWAALAGAGHPRCEALDTGCVWGGSLTAYRLEDGQRFAVPGKRSH